MAVLQLDLPMLTADEWVEIERLADILVVFEVVTIELSAEKTVTVSKILTLIDSIKDHLQEKRKLLDTDVDKDKYPRLAPMLEKLEEKFVSRSVRYDRNTVVAGATFLDPRFKKHGFPHEYVFDRTKAALITMAGK